LASVTGLFCLLSPELSNAAEPAAAPAPASRSQVSKKVNVTLESTGQAVSIALVSARMASARAMIGQRAIVTSTSSRELCTSPCSFQIAPGVYELEVSAPEVTSASGRFALQTDGSKLRVQPGSASLSTGGFWLTAAGIAAATFGSLYLFVGKEDVTDFRALPLMLIGGASAGIGIAMMRIGNTSFEKVGAASPIRESSVASRVGLTLNGTL
jgi:hypothetical protein